LENISINVVMRTKEEIKKQQAIMRTAQGRLYRLELQLETLEIKSK